MKKFLEALFVFVGSALFFSIFQPWGAFRDPDAFYHAKMTSLLLTRGIVRSFPWLDLTTLGQQFVDQHFLYHLLNAPFIYFFGMLQGQQIGTVFFAGLFIVSFFLLLKWLRIPRAFLWMLLLLFLPPVIARLNLGKASPLAMLFFFLGLIAFMKRSRVALFFTMVFYVLTHGGWPLLIVIFGVYSCGEMIYERFIAEKNLKELWGCISSVYLPLFLAVFFGTVVGILMHPYRASLIPFLKTQIFSIGVQTPFDQVVLGIEWLPYSLVSFLKDFSLLWMMAFVLLFGFVFTRRLHMEKRLMRWSIGLGLCSAVLLALTLKSRRFGEYMGPAFVLWFAVLGSAIDWKKMFREFRLTDKYLQLLLVALPLIAFGWGLFATYDFFHTSLRTFHRFDSALQMVDEHLQPGERLFHSNWAQFPELFSSRDSYRYIAGLDPVFLLEAHPDLSRDYTKLMMNDVGIDPYDVIRNKFDSSVALYEQGMDTDMIRRLKSDERFRILHEDDVAVVFLLR